MRTIRIIILKYLLRKELKAHRSIWRCNDDCLYCRIPKVTREQLENWLDSERLY